MAALTDDPRFTATTFVVIDRGGLAPAGRPVEPIEVAALALRLSVMVDDAPRARIAQAYGTLHCYWAGYAVPAQFSATAPSGIVALRPVAERRCLPPSASPVWTGSVPACRARSGKWSAVRTMVDVRHVQRAVVDALPPVPAWRTLSSAATTTAPGGVAFVSHALIDSSLTGHPVSVESRPVNSPRDIPFRLRAVVSWLRAS